MKFSLIPINGRKLQVLIATCMYLGQMTLGFVVGWSGVMFPKLRDRDQSPLEELLTETQFSLIASIIYMGGLIGPFLSGWVSNIKGRKPCLSLGGIIAAIGFIVLVSRTNFTMLVFGRLLCGIGICCTGVMNFVYIGEIASTNIRGILLTAMGVFHTMGTVILYTTSYFLSYTGTNYVGLALCIAFTLSTLLIPESPIFYLLKGKDDAVLKSLHKLGRSEDIDRLLTAKKDVKKSTSNKDWIELFSLRCNRKALFIVIVINILQHFSGVMVVVFFAGTIFEMAGSTMELNTSMLIITAFQLTGSCLSPFLVERGGRKVLLVISSSICALAMFLLGLYFYLDHIGNPVIEQIKIFPLIVLILFFIGYDSGLGIIPNVLIGEMFTVNVRSKGSALALATTWVAGFVISTGFGSIIESSGYISFWIFTATCLAAVLFTIFCVVETKGKSLLEIQELLSK